MRNYQQNLFMNCLTAKYFLSSFKTVISVLALLILAFSSDVHASNKPNVNASPQNNASNPETVKKTQSATKTLYLNFENIRTPVVLSNVEGTWIDLECHDKVRAKKICRAYLVLKKQVFHKKVAPSKNAAVSALPHVSHCQSTGGSLITLEDEGRNQHSYCRFEDQSLVDSWGLVAPNAKRLSF